MIEARNLTKHYGPTRSVEDISFRVEKGEVLGFLGPNGAGKSTTIRMLTGLMRPTAGVAAIAGLDVQRHHEQVRRMIGYLPEGAPLYHDMTLGKYLEFMGGIKGLDGRRARTEMERTTELVNLQKERPRLLRNLSKGMRQRAALAQALLGDPEVLLLDEPTVGLDPSQINDVRRLVNSFAGRRTVLLSTHILPEVEMTCTRIVIIAGGRIAAQGTPAELTRQRAPEFRFAVRGDADAAAAIASASAPGARVTTEARDGVVHGTVAMEGDADPRPALASALVRGGMELIELRRHEVRLEEVFLRAVATAAAEDRP